MEKKYELTEKAEASVAGIISESKNTTEAHDSNEAKEEPKVEKKDENQDKGSPKDEAQAKEQE